MNYLGYIFKGRPQIDSKRFALMKELFDREQYKLIESYESKIGNLNKMNSAMVS